nr:hypothetical protein [uncultured bacterium]
MSRPVSRKPSPGALRMRLLHQRRQEGRQRVESPWSWLTIADVKKLAGEAYRIASHDTRDGRGERVGGVGLIEVDRARSARAFS